MVSGDFCQHDWPGSGCPECKCHPMSDESNDAARARSLRFLAQSRASLNTVQISKQTLIETAARLEALIAERDERHGWFIHWQTKCQATAGLLVEARTALAAERKRTAELEGALGRFANFKDCSASDVYHARKLLGLDHLTEDDGSVRAALQKDRQS